MENRPKFITAEIVLGTLVAGAIDVISAIADFLGGGILGFIVQGLSWLMFTLWFTMKGVKLTASLAKRFLVPIAVQAVPVIPTMMITFLATVYMENHPEKFGAITKVAGAAKGKPATAK